MASEHDLLRRIEELESEQAKIEEELAELREARASHGGQFEQCREEQRRVEHEMDDWSEKARPDPFPKAPLAVFFLGPVSGEWAAQSRYRGDLPGFGGFLVVAGGLNIVVDPGPSTLANLHAANIHPKTLDVLVATHSHWDCVRDLPLLIRSATHEHVSAARTTPPRLRLLAPEAVLRGQPMAAEDVVQHPLFQTSGSIQDTLERLAEFPTMNGPVINVFDLFLRLRGQFDTLEIDRRYPLSPGVQIRTRRSFHGDTFGVETIPALDILVLADGQVTNRCVYLSDTEYRPELADEYARDELRPIDILICNVKTLDIGERKDEPHKGFTVRQLGWKGLIQLTRDFQKRGLLTEQSRVVLRAWGIETVTRLDPYDGVMTATPEKLRVYEEAYQRLTGQPAVVPGQTWVAVSAGADAGSSVRHVRHPFPEEGTFQRFGPIMYCSEAMSQVVRNVRPVVDNRSEVLLVTGETGTGKDALAHAIHGEGKLLIHNAQELGADTAWTHLFGFTRNAFTGAERETVGLLADPSATTWLIQEVDELPLQAQVRLLTVLGERKFQRLGDGKEYNLNIRVIMTTSADIDKLVAEGRFRKELRYRIQRHVVMPPLRDRLEDIPAIVHGMYIEDPKKYRRLDKTALELLQRYPWPGNVRALRMVLERLSHGGDWSFDRIRREIEAVPGAIGRGVQAPPRAIDALGPDDRRVLELICNRGLRRRREIEEQWGNGRTKGAVLNVLKRLVRMDLVRQLGGGPNVRYEPIDGPTSL